MRACLPLCALLAAIGLVGCGGHSSSHDAGAAGDTGGAHDGPVNHDDGGTGQDAGPPTDGAPGDGAPGDGAAGSLWLHTSGNHIYTADDQVWKGRGANLHDTRSCNACTWSAPDVGEVKRRADELIDNWGANFVRLDLESYASADGRTHWAGLLVDSAYFDDIKEIVAYITAKAGVYVLASLWVDPTFTNMGWPTASTIDEWVALAGAFLDNPKVLYGLCNEPQSNFDGSLDSQVWTAMNDAVAAIRTVEDNAGKPHHIITAQGTGGWSRRLDYYVTHPITAGGGANIAYEVHVYDPQSSFQSEWVTPAQSIPVVIGEYGPASGYMTEADCTALMQQARTNNVPHLAWTFHMRCDPSLLVDNSGGGCGVGMTLTPTSWGNVLKTGLATAW